MSSSAAFSPLVTICGDLAEMAETARQEILKIILAAPNGAQVSLALSGGSTPKKLYEKLHDEDLALFKDGKHVLFFLGDDRLCPLDNPQSNYHMATQALLRDVPADCVIPVDVNDAVATSEDPEGGEAGARKAAATYEKVLLSRLPSECVTVDGQESPVQVPIADIVLLGFGSDGHTASVFPGSIAAADRTAAVSVSFPSPTMTPKVWRLTLTPVAICEAKHVIVLAAGKDKRWVVDGILSGEEPAPDAAPVARFLRKCRGQVHFILDADSAPSTSL